MRLFTSRRPLPQFLARLALVPLSFISGATLIFFFIAIPLSVNLQSPPSYVVVEALCLASLVSLTIWSNMLCVSISFPYHAVHKLRFWAWTLPAFCFVYMADFIAWTHVVQPLESCPDMPACETTIGGICSPADLFTYTSMTLCQVNKVIFGTSIAIVFLQLSALIVLTLTRIIPACQRPEDKLWRENLLLNESDNGVAVSWHRNPIRPRHWFCCGKCGAGAESMPMKDRDSEDVEPVLLNVNSAKRESGGKEA